MHPHHTAPTVVDSRALTVLDAPFPGQLSPSPPERSAPVAHPYSAGPPSSLRPPKLDEHIRFWAGRPVHGSRVRAQARDTALFYAALPIFGAVALVTGRHHGYTRIEEKAHEWARAEAPWQQRPVAELEAEYLANLTDDLQHLDHYAAYGMAIFVAWMVAILQAFVVFGGLHLVVLTMLVPLQLPWLLYRGLLGKRLC